MTGENIQSPCLMALLPTRGTFESAKWVCTAQSPAQCRASPKAQVVLGEWCSTLSKTLRDKCKCTDLSQLRFERNEKNPKCELATTPLQEILEIKKAILNKASPQGNAENPGDSTSIVGQLPAGNKTRAIQSRRTLRLFFPFLFKLVKKKKGFLATKDKLCILYLYKFSKAHHVPAI